MDEVTQQNAALVEEAAAASEAMQDQAAQLAQAVSIFRVNGGNVTPAVSTAAVRKATSAPRQPGRERSSMPATKSARRAHPVLASNGPDDWETF